MTARPCVEAVADGEPGALAPVEVLADGDAEDEAEPEGLALGVADGGGVLATSASTGRK